MATDIERLAALEIKAKQLRAKLQRKAAADRRKKQADERRADAHRKIELGGLVIASGLDGWDPAEIVGALLTVGQHTDKRAAFKERGITHLEARAANRKGARS